MTDKIVTEAMPESTDRVCGICGATVAAWPEVMVCHCYEMPWKRAPSTAQEPALDDDALMFAMLNELHANMPEMARPLSLSDLSDEQLERARKAVRAVIVGAGLSKPAGRYPSIAALEADDDAYAGEMRAERVMRRAKQVGDAKGDPNYWRYLEQARDEDRLQAKAPETETADALKRAFLFICENMPLGPTNDRTEAGKLIDSLRAPLSRAFPEAPETGEG